MKALVATFLIFFSLFAFAQTESVKPPTSVEVTEKSTVKLLDSETKSEKDTVTFRTRDHWATMAVIFGCALIAGFFGGMWLGSGPGFILGLLGGVAGYMLTQGYIGREVTYQQFIVQDQDGKEFKIRSGAQAPVSVGENMVMLRFADGTIGFRKP